MTQALVLYTPRILTQAQAGANALLWVKRGIYLYFWLLILEGALRKWILPQFSAPLLIVRDPVLLFIYLQAFRSHRLKTSEFIPVAVLAFASLLLAAAQIGFGDNDALTAVFGLRSYFLHLPLIFIIKQTLTAHDLKRIGKWLLVIVLPMALLMVAQFNSASASWLNTGAGEGSKQLAFTGEHVRASGTFSFIAGVSDFFPLAFAVLLFALAEGGYPKYLVIAASIGAALAIPSAGSRTLIIESGILLLCACLVSVRNRSFVRLLKPGIVLLIAALVASQTSIFRQSVSALQSRWSEAGEAEGGNGVGGTLELRVLQPVLESFQAESEIPSLGLGIGLGSNTAAALKTGGRTFLLAETEWPRVFEEFGPFFGLALMLFRVWLCMSLFFTGFRASSRGSYLGLLFASVAIPQLGVNNMEQPTHLGFMVLAAGLSLAASKLNLKSIRVIPAASPKSARHHPQSSPYLVVGP